MYHIYVIIQYKVTGWPLGPWSRHKLPIMSSEQPPSDLWPGRAEIGNYKIHSGLGKEERHKNEIEPICFKCPRIREVREFSCVIL